MVAAPGPRSFAARGRKRGPIGCAAQCLRCHEHGQAAADYKRGTPFDAEHDVHAAAGLKCTDCHKVDNHKIARGSRVTDMHAWERQNVEVTCANCHSATKPHTTPALAMYNEHLSAIACETCHIPWTSGAMRRVWGPTFGITNGRPVFRPDSTTGTFEPYSVYSGEYNLRPAYRWFNGNESMLAEPLHDVNAWDSRVATKATPGAKIYPFRSIINGMILDRRGFGYDPNFNTNFTMLAAMDVVTGPLKQMGFMRPAGLTPQERAAMAQYPNLLKLRRGNLFSLRQHSGIDQHRSGKSGLDDVGAGLLWRSAGNAQRHWLELLERRRAAIGLAEQSDGIDPIRWPAHRTTGSFISLSHAIKRNGALTCNECHSAAGVMDFKALSCYPVQQESHAKPSSTQCSRSRPRQPARVKLQWATIPGRTYQLLSTTNLHSGAWLTVTNLPATNRLMETVIPTGQITTESQRYFRVKEISP